MYSRRVFTGIKSLMHFDFPHYYASNSGLKDEVPGHVWNVSGGALFAGRYQPADAVFNNAPKFGYRCLYTQSNSDYVYSSGLSGTINPAGTLSAEIFINIQSSTAGNILAFVNGNTEIFSLSVTASRTVKISSATWNISANNDTPLTLNTWHHLRLTITGNTVKVYADGSQIISQASGSSSLTYTAMRIGGANALFDEFILRDNIPSLAVPSQPYNLALDMTKMGGFGTGRDGELSNDSGIVYINTYGHVTAASGKNFSVYTWYTSMVKNSVRTINAGDEVMFLVFQKSNGPDDLCGLYAFRNIISIDGKNFSVDAPVSEEFDIADALANYIIYCYKIPHFSSVNITGGNLSHRHYVAAFRCSGDVNFAGGFHIPNTFSRYDSHNLTHSDLPDRMIPSAGNFIMTCGGKFSAPEGARLGHVITGSLYRDAGYGGKGNCIMIPTNASHIYGCNILIAAKRLAVDSSALAYGAKNSQSYSGLCYLAGDLS